MKGDSGADCPNPLLLRRSSRSNATYRDGCYVWSPRGLPLMDSW
jgi:hypothetical protein